MEVKKGHSQRAVAYCRVSSDHDDQLSSLANQKQYWEEYIEGNPSMIFCGLYVDEGLSGTSTLKRDGFNQMIRDARQNKFDVILTKEVSRFARNTIDVLSYTRQLKELGIGVYFQNDNIYSLDKDGELRLSLMATLAQEESRKTSERVKWGHKRAMNNGVVFGADRILGYDLINKKLTINEEEAEIVRKIFNWYREGESLHGIVRKLADIGFTRGKLNGSIDHTWVKRALTNEKYCGDLVQRKYYTTDYLTHKQIKNTGEEPLIIIEDNHPSIVTKEVWKEVQNKLLGNRKKFKEEGVGYSRHVWGGKMTCGNCGKKFRRRVLKNKDGSDRPVWICPTAYDKGKKGCENSSYIREEILEQIFMDIFTQLKQDKSRQKFVEEIISVLARTLADTNSTKGIEEINKQLFQVTSQKKKLLNLYLSGSSLDDEMFNEKNEELQRVENNLREALEAAENKSQILQTKKEKLEKLYEQLNDRSELTEFKRSFVEEYLEEIIVVNKSQLTVKLVAQEYNVDRSEYPKRVCNGNHPPWRPLGRAGHPEQQEGNPRHQPGGGAPLPARLRISGRRQALPRRSGVLLHGERRFKQRRL